MKKKLMILASALLLAGGYATYTAVQNSVLIQSVLAENNDKQILYEYKNRWLGLVPGCKKAENLTCTVKDVDIDISIL